MKDEPTILREIVVPIHARDVVQSIRMQNGASASLLLGAPSQDDCAAYRLEGEVVLVAGSDYIRGVGFHLHEAGLMEDYDIGWYLAGANFSDVAAMGAVPLGLLSVVRYPKEMAESRFEEILNGIAESCRAVGALNVGGDIGTAESVILSGSAFGIVEPDRLLRRSGARPGDLLCLTGATGEAGAALKLARAGQLSQLAEEDRDGLLARWRRVSPRVIEGRLLAESGHAHACIDTSDGLRAAIETIADASRVRAIVFREQVPLASRVIRAAELLNVAAEEVALGDSVDFELLACVEPEGLEELEERFAAAGRSLFVIGRIDRGEGAFWHADGADRPLPGVAWRH